MPKIGKWRLRLRQFRQGELPADVADWPEEWLEEFEERAAIMEFDGELTTVEAEDWAETIVRAFYQLNKRDIATQGDITSNG